MLSDTLACRAIAAEAQRLACFDRAVAALQNAYSKDDLLIVDKETVRRNKRSLFGLTLPSFDLFGGDKPDKEDSEISATVRSAEFQSDGHLFFVLDSGATWVQTDDDTIPSLPKAGASITLKSGALGSYFATIGHSSFRARRVK